MVDEKKLARLLELNSQREAIDAEITVLMGGDVPKRRYTKRNGDEQPQQNETPGQ
jgi:hypothetical protein